MSKTINVYLNKVLLTDALNGLRNLPDKSVHCIVTSPPYWNLRDYEIEGQLGLEDTPEEFIANMVLIFREAYRVLRDDGTLWVNIGDSYAAKQKNRSLIQATRYSHLMGGPGTQMTNMKQKNKIIGDLKAKDMVGIPWALAKALREPYYTGRIKNEMDRVWMAAILDGKGSISTFEHTRKDDGRTRTGLNISVTNSNNDLLNKCSKIFPASLHNNTPNGKGHLGKREVNRWIPSRAKNKAQFLSEIYPYLIVKKEQAFIGYNFCLLTIESKRDAHGDLHKENETKRMELVKILKKLNANESVEYPKWLKPVPTLYESGWYLRQDIIWAKPNPMPESTRDRCTKAHEYIFLFSKSVRYYYDQKAIATSISDASVVRLQQDVEGYNGSERAYGGKRHNGPAKAMGKVPHGWDTNKGNHRRNKGSYKDERTEKVQNDKIAGRGLLEHNGYFDGDGNLIGDGLANRRSVWTISTQAFREAHFATFPEKLPSLCIRAGTSAFGCCAECYAPYKRVTEKQLKPLKKAPKKFVIDDRDSNTDDQGSNRARDGHKPGHYYETKTTGWIPTCKCDCKDVVKPIVLDMFGGAGTTGLVAVKLGRDFIEMELSPKYIRINEARKRKDIGGLFYS